MEENTNLPENELPPTDENLLDGDDVETEGETEAEQDSEGDEESRTEGSDDYEEVDVNGKTYQVPKELKGAFLMQQDYTRKTQEVAEARRELEQQQALVRASNETIEQRVQLSAIDNQLNQFNGIDWQRFTRENPVEAQIAFQNYQQLKESRQNLSNEITAKESEIAYTQQAATQAKLEKAREELKRDIPNWSPELGKQLAEFGHKQLGFSQEEMASVTDPRLVKLLHAAYTGRQLVQGKVDSAKAKPATQVKPVRPLSGSNSPSSKDPSRMNTDEWMRHRQDQLSKKRGK